MSEVKEAEVSIEADQKTITTTTEQIAATVSNVRLRSRTNRVLLIAWAQVSTGTACSALTPRIRRGAAITGALVNEANAEEVKAAAGSREFVMTMGIDEREGEESVEYSVTVQQTDASANGSVDQAGIVALVL